MVIRRDAAGALAIGQPAHAFLCGQIARAWGNERFGAVAPLDEVALGAEQHDVGMGRWDLTPTLDADTGLPASFLTMGLPANLALWRRGPERLIGQSRYAALLAVMHGRQLYERLDREQLSAADADAVAEMLAESAALQARLTDALQADPVTAPMATADAIARNSRLVASWDSLSLALLLDWAPHTLVAVPTAGGGAVDIDVTATAPRDGLPSVSLSPWPLREPEPLVVHTEGRRCRGEARSESELHAELDRAPWETLRFVLVPA